MSRATAAFVLIFTILGVSVKAQTSFNVYNDGMSTLVLESGLTATILGGYVSQTNTGDGTIDNQSTIQLTGDWANNNAGAANPFVLNTGTIELVGTTEQTISGTATTVFNDLVINNTALGGGVTLARIVEVASTLTLTDGILTTSSGSPLVMNVGSSSGPGSAASYVDGPMRKAGSTAFTFPLGSNGVWARLAIGSPSTSTTFEAQYFNTGYTNTTSMAASPTPALNNVSTIEYWNLSRSTGTGTATVDVYWENASTSDINSCPDLKLARWNGGGWENTYNTSGSGSCAGTGSGSISSSAAVTSYDGPITFGSVLVDPTNPLPIELARFDANLVNDVVELSWTTASEVNNDFFTLEKSSDGFDFVEIGVVDGAGNSTIELNYAYKDYSPYIGFSYYRLKQTDFDGTSSYSDIALVVYDKEVSASIFPNPSQDNTININMDGSEGREVLISIHNSMGKIVHSEIIVQQEGAMISTIKLPKSLPSGIYVVVGQAQGILFQSKLVILKD